MFMNSIHCFPQLNSDTLEKKILDLKFIVHVETCYSVGVETYGNKKNI